MPSDCDISRFLQSCQAITPRVLESAARAVEQFGAHILGDAQTLAPVDTGTLKASATWEKPQISGSTVTMIIGFNTSYAAAVHERLSVRHKQGQAKFLEIPLKRAEPKFGPFIEKRVMGTDS